MKTLWLCVLVLFAVSSADAQIEVTQLQYEPHALRMVKIGFVLPLSGDWAFLGTGIRDAALLAQADLKLGPVSVGLIFEDNRGLLPQSASAAHKLIDLEKVDAVISIISGVGLLIKPLAEKARILNFGICSNISVAGGCCSFTNYITTAEGARAFIEEATRNRRQPVKLGIFAVNEEGFNQVLRQVQDQSAGRLVDIVFVENFEPQTRDFRTLVLRAMAKKPDLLLILGLSPEIETLAEQLKQLNFQVPMASIEGFGLAENKQIFNGSWFVDAAAPSAEFAARFKAAYGRQITAGAGHAYDTVRLIARSYGEAWKGSEKPTAVEVARELHACKVYEGVVGKLSVDEAGIVHSTPSIKIIKNGAVLSASDARGLGGDWRAR